MDNAPRPAPRFERRRRTRLPVHAGAPAIALGLLALSLGTACSNGPVRVPLDAGFDLSTWRGDDDLLTAGLGADGLRSATPPPFANPDAPTRAELRRRAIWANWRGIADLSPGSGYGTVYGSLAPVPGREYHAFVTLPGAKQTHRVLVQVPDQFDAGKRCVVVAASSGSRGIYGAIALAGAWGLPRGCAVAYTDKGAGTGYVDLASGQGSALTGLPAQPGERAEFMLPATPGQEGVAVKHAHSGDNPEADWGRHVQQAARVALQVLALARPQDGPWTWENTRIIATGLSNGGGAVLRAAEVPGPEFDAVVAIAPNIWPAEGGRALHDYVTEAALWMPCALTAPAFDAVLLARPGGQPNPAGVARCASLATDGKLAAGTARDQAIEAHAVLTKAGWSDDALVAGALSTQFDLWRAVAVTYASAYAGTGPSAMPCGFRFAALGADGAVRAPTAAERAAWWSDASGIPPGAGVGIVDSLAGGADPAYAGLQCLRATWDEAGAVHAGVQRTQAGLPRAGLPVIVVHGRDDGLVPEAFSGAAYARWAEAAGRPVTYWSVAHAQHFDAFLGLPVLGAAYVPLLPYGYRALDAAWTHLESGAPLPEDRAITPTPRGFAEGAVPALEARHLALP